MPTAGKVALIGGGGVTLFFLGRAVVDHFTGASSSTAAQPVDTSTSGDSSGGSSGSDSGGSSGTSGSAADYSSALDSLAQGQTQLAQILATNQQQLTSQLAQNDQQTGSALNSLMGQMSQGGATSSNQIGAVQPQYQAPISTIPSRNTVQTPGGVMVTATGSDSYNQAVDKAVGQWINRKWVAGSYGSSGQFVAKTQSGANVYNSYEESTGHSARATAPAPARSAARPVARPVRKPVRKQVTKPKK